MGNTLGYYNKNFRIPIIHINQDADRESQFFIVAHELGMRFNTQIQTLLFKKAYSFSTDKLEIEANTFAVELLLPDELFVEKNDSCFTIFDAIKEKGVPEELLSLKSIDGKIFTKNRTNILKLKGVSYM